MSWCNLSKQFQNFALSKHQKISEHYKQSILEINKGYWSILIKKKNWEIEIEESVNEYSFPPLFHHLYINLNESFER